MTLSTSLPDRLVSDRLRLILFSPADVEDMLGHRRQDRWHPQYPQSGDVDAASMARSCGTWGPRHIVLDQRAVGSVGFFGRPVDGEVQVALSVVPELRRRGIGSEALALLLTEADARGLSARAVVRPENVAALTLLATQRFTHLREATAEGDLVLGRAARS